MADARPKSVVAGETVGAAWRHALYGPDGFYARESPADHFRTSVNAGPLLADVVIALLRRYALRSVTDVGAGSGELLAALHARDPGLTLIGVDVRPRPAGLPASVGWRPTPPEEIDGLLFANELLDNVPTEVGIRTTTTIRRATTTDLDVVTVAAAGDGPPMPAAERAWFDRWWPLDEPGAMGDCGLARDEFWSGLVGRLRTGLAVLVDFGHTRTDRPPSTTLRSYRRGRRVDLDVAGDRDVCADVAVDSVRAAVGGTLYRQRELLHDLGFRADRPSLEMARTDPAGYLRALSAAGDVAELTGSPGLGDFWWLLTPAR